jgi:peptidoglycan lytic transglycosylase A
MPPAKPRPPAQPATAMAPLLRLDAVDFAALAGWQNGDPRKGLEAFRRSCVSIREKPADEPLGGVYAGIAGDWRDVCDRTDAIQASSPEAVRAFFESDFVPFRISQGAQEGLFTGYYEPELRGSRTRHGPYQTPIYGVPSDLVNIDGEILRDTAAGQPFVERMLKSMLMMRFVPYPARAEIERNGVPGKPLFYVDDPIAVFFLQIQGSGRVALDDGSAVRAAYAGQNGQPYTAIGTVLIERGELTSEELSLQSIRAWLIAHPDEARAVMDADASYVFFSEQPIGDPAQGAVGAEGVPLTPEASLAVDLSVHPLGVPVWLEASAPDRDATKPDRTFERLLVMQDTGGAIRGALRGDVYWGIGKKAESIAGRMKHFGRLSVLLPRGLAARLTQHGDFAAP